MIEIVVWAVWLPALLWITYRTWWEVVLLHGAEAWLDSNAACSRCFCERADRKGVPIPNAIARFVGVRWIDIADRNMWRHLYRRDCDYKP